jgi:hypothetical protein
LSSRHSDRIQRERKDQIGLRVSAKNSLDGIALMKSSGQSRTGQQTNEERAGCNSLAPQRVSGRNSDSCNASRCSVNRKHFDHSPAYESKRLL